MDRTLIHTNSTCRVEVLHFKNDDISISNSALENSDSAHRQLMDTERITIVDAVTQCQINKSIGEVRGTFDFLLMPTENWKLKIRPGDWLIIYLSRDGIETPRMLGNVDRVSRAIQVAPDGKKMVRFKVSGSDFGKVFDKYDIYWNPFVPATIAAQAFINDKQLRFLGRPNEILNDILEVFLGNGVNTHSKEYPEILQWFMPERLTEFFPANSPASSDVGLKFFDILKQEIESVGGYKVWDNIHTLQGNLWNIMKRSSNSVLNELFVELKKTPGKNEYRPTLVLRTIPFTRGDYQFLNGMDDSQIVRFKDLPTVTVTTDEILQEDLGQNDHARFNYFLLWSQTPQIDGRSLTDAISVGGNAFPRLLKGSIRRNGLMTKIDTTDFSFLSSTTSGGNSAKFSQRVTDDLELLKAWNDVLAHWYTREHLYETGTVLMLGNPDIELGKRIVIQDKMFGERDRAYYIESYADSWEFPERWITTLSLTRGQDAESEEPLFETENPKTAQIGTTHVKHGFARKLKGNN